MKQLAGIIPYVVSPVNMDGIVDAPVLKRLCNDLIDSGVHGLCALGSVGEFPYLTLQQKQVVVQSVVQVSGGRVPVLAGVSGFSVHQAILEAQSFVELGVDGLVVMLQQYFPLKDEQIVEFFKLVAQSVPDCPIVLYSNPKYMHFELSMRVFESLCEVPNILYYKDASGNTGKLLTLSNRFPGRFTLFSASAHIPLFVSLLGGAGWMAGPACLIPRQCVKLYDLCRAGEFDEAMKLQRAIWDVNRVFGAYELTACILAGLEHLGYPVGSPIAPLRPLGASERAEVSTIIDSIRSIG